MTAPAAWAVLFASVRARARLAALARGYCGDEAEDAVQDAALRLLSMPAIPEAGSRHLGALVTLCVQRSAIDRARRRSLRPVPLGLWHPAGDEDGDSMEVDAVRRFGAHAGASGSGREAQERETRREAASALRWLRRLGLRSYARSAALIDHRGLSVAEAAGRMGTSTGGVKMARLRARRRLDGRA